MKIINYKKINEISPTSKCMIFCTCAESNQRHYFEKIKLWFNRYKNFEGDFYIFNDGKILEENLTKEDLNDSLKLAELIVAVLDSKKAKDIKLLHAFSHHRISIVIGEVGSCIINREMIAAEFPGLIA